MRRAPIFLPFSFLFFLALLFLLLFLFIFLYVGLIGAAYEKLGISPFSALLLLFLSLWGSMVNIPVATLSGEEVVRRQVVSFFGIRYVIPVIEERRTILAVNLGGAVIPTLLSIYLMGRIGITSGLILSIGIVTFVVNRMAVPVRGLGIAMPALIPPVLSAITALILVPEESPAVAYISGTLGTLIGADILNLGRIRGLGAPVASIGGAGTFDGIFLTGIIAVILA